MGSWDHPQTNMISTLPLPLFSKMHGGQHSRVQTLVTAWGTLSWELKRWRVEAERKDIFLSFSCSFLLELKKEAGCCQNYVPTNTRNCNTGMIIAKEKENLHPHPWGKHTRQINTKQLPTRIPPPCHIPTQSYFPPSQLKGSQRSYPFPQQKGESPWVRK